MYLGKVWESVSCDGGSCHHATNGAHGKTSVLQFCKLHFLLLGRVFGVKTNGVESKVTWCSVEFVHVGQSGERNGLHEGDPSKDLDHGFGELVVSLQDGGDAFEGVRLTGDANEFGNDKSKSGQHGGTAVLQLGLTEPWEPFRSTLVKRKNRES